MKKTNFLEQLENVAQAANDFIKKNVKPGKQIIFLSEEERDMTGDKLYELPVGSKVSKHGFYDEFAIVSIRNQKGEILFEGVCKGEGDNSDLVSEHISDSDLCMIADLISKKL